MSQSSMTFPAALHDDNYSQKCISIGMKADICQENYASSLQTSAYSIHIIERISLLSIIFKEANSKRFQ